MFRNTLIALSLLLSSSAMAAEWTADRVRGDVQYQSGSAWLPLERGAAIGDGTVIQTGSNGRADLTRGADHVSLGPDTHVQVRDAGADLMTTVIQTSGIVTADVERRNVQHFSVQTPFLAAVVKGTKFTVTADRNGAHVEVDRGVVQVQDSENGRVADVRPGQEATVTADAPLEVVGANATVFTTNGTVVTGPVTPPQSATTTTETQTGTNAVGNSVNDNRGHGNGNGNSGNNGNGNGNSGNGNSGNGNSGNGNSGNNGNGNSGNNGNGNSGNQGNGNGNSGNNGNGNSNSGNGNSGNGNSGNGNSDNNGNGGNSGNGNSGNQGNGNDNSGNGNSGNNGNGNGNGGNNGNGNGNSDGNNGNGKGHNN